MDTNVIYCDDNLKRLALLPDDSIELIYLDPPFFSNRHYEVIWGDEAEVRSFEDRWEGGIRHYVGWMRERMLEMHRVLKPTGSIYLHCDWHAAHYLKQMMDDIFGYNNFQNEIIWFYGAGGRSRKRFGRKHDNILFYTKKGDGYVFNEKEVRVEMKAGRSSFGGRLETDKDGRKYRLVWGTGRKKLYKYYLDEGKVPEDVWEIPSLQSQDEERLGYPTQKPQELLKRIIKASSNKNDIILDPFCGCGTTLVTAHQLKRHWIGIDISPTACNLMKRRLAKIGAASVKIIGMPTTLEDLKGLRPFEFQNWIIDRINGIQSNKKAGDMGIDGWTWMLHDPIQIKQSEGVGRDTIDKFESAIQRVGRDRGFVIAFSFTRGSYEEVARVRTSGLLIHLIEVKQILAGIDAVYGLMGINLGLPEFAAAPMPEFGAKKRSAADLLRSQKAAD